MKKFVSFILGTLGSVAMAAATPFIFNGAAIKSLVPYTDGILKSSSNFLSSSTSTTDLPEGTNLYFTQSRARLALSVIPPLLFNSGTGVFSIPQASSSVSGYLSSTDWTTFNNKLSKTTGNYITNPDAEIDTSGWNLYNNTGRTVPASVVDQDITYTSALSGGGGNGATITYGFCGSSFAPPVVTCPTASSVNLCWYNGPTISQNPTATQVKAAFDGTPCAVAIASSAITGTASNLQYQNGVSTLVGGGDAAPTTGTGGSPSGVTFTRTTVNPIAGVASFDLGKIASSELGQGVSTDFIINAVDTNSILQISFAYSASSGMTLGTNSDVQVFLYDITNATMIPVTPLRTIAGPVSTINTFVGQFTTTTSVQYRLILHIATANATAWDLECDQVVVNDELNPTAATQVPSVVLQAQPISGAVTDHMVVMWQDGAANWVPATIAGAALPTFGDDQTQLGFATNIVGSEADIFVSGFMDGFSFGPFVQFAQYIDNTAGHISPLPSPFTDLWVQVGMAISSTALNIQFVRHVDAIANSSGVSIKGGLLTSSAVNDGTGDIVLTPGTNGTMLVANSAAANGINWVAPVATSPLVYTAATHTFSLNTVPVASGGTGLTSTSQNFAFLGPTSGSGAPTFRAIVAGDIPTLNQNTTGSAAKWTTARNLAGNSVDGSANVAFANKFIVQGTADAGLSGPQFLGDLGTGLLKNTTTTGVLSIAAAADVTGQLLTGFSSGAGTVSATDSILQGFNKVIGNISALTSTSISNSSGVTGATVTAALNTLNQSVQEVLLSAIKNAGSVTANTTIPTWTTTSKDSLSGFNASTGVYTVQAAGDLLVNFTSATTTGTPLSQVYHNGSLVQTGIGSGVRTSVSTVIPNCVVGDTITVALDTSLTITSTNTDTILNINQLAGSSSSVVNARYHSATATITASLSDVSWTTKDFDTASAFSGATFTVPSNGAGTYEVFGSLGVTAATVAAGNAEVLTLNQNGVEISRYTFIAGAATQKPMVLVLNDLFKFSAGDTIKFQVSSASTTPTVSASTTQNRFYINKVSN